MIPLPAEVRSPLRRSLGAILAGALLAGLVSGVTGLLAPTAMAAGANGTFVASSSIGSSGDAETDPATPATVTADALPTWQIDGVVWDTVTVGDIVYATGEFSTARPPGTAVGDPASVARRNILAFDLTTGEVTDFQHTLNGAGRRIVASPDGRTIYVGGEFTTVDGARHVRLAAFDVASGDLVASFRAAANHRVRALAVTATTVYLGGDFDRVGRSNRKKLAAVSRATGQTLAWRPSADGSVWAMAVAPGGRLIVGGQFQRLDGRAKVGVGALSTRTGALATWTSRPIPARLGRHNAFVTDLVVSRGVVYGTANGNGPHWFDGRFAARASDGALVWLDNCYGATYSAYVSGSVLYSVGHAHDCSSLGAFPETSPRRWQRALAETITATRRDSADPSTNANYRHTRTPSLLHWFPALDAGSYTGLDQGAWAITGNGSYVALAGEFTTVNGIAQQGLTRFAVAADAPREVGPVASAGLRPALSAADGGVGVRLDWLSTWDQDDATLTYTIIRDDGAQPVGTLSSGSQFWSLGALSYVDTTAQPGSTYRYRIVASDPDGNEAAGDWSAPITAG